MQKKTRNKKAQKSTNFVQNAELINDFVVKYILENKGKKVPTQYEIAKQTKLHRNTVATHYKNLKFEPLNSVQRSFTPLVLNNLLALTKKSPTAIKLWLQVMEGWTEEQILNIKTPAFFGVVPKSEEITYNE